MTRESKARRRRRRRSSNDHNNNNISYIKPRTWAILSFFHSQANVLRDSGKRRRGRERQQCLSSSKERQKKCLLFRLSDFFSSHFFSYSSASSSSSSSSPSSLLYFSFFTASDHRKCHIHRVLYMCSRATCMKDILVFLLLHSIVCRDMWLWLSTTTPSYRVRPLRERGSRRAREKERATQ